MVRFEHHLPYALGSNNTKHVALFAIVLFAIVLFILFENNNMAYLIRMRK
jgi:hypothetical protein